MTMNNNRGGRVVGPHLDPLIWRSSGNGPDRLKETREVDEENGLPVALYVAKPGSEEAEKVGYGNALPVRGEGVFQVEPDDVLYDIFESITVSTTAVALTASRRTTHTHAYITVEGAPVRWRPDGDSTAPTATVGHVLEAGDVLELRMMEQLEHIRFIRRDATDGTLMVSYGNRRSA